jgi:uncharacterized protein (TIGR02452 family)
MHSITQRPASFLDRINCWSDTLKLVSRLPKPPASLKWFYDANHAALQHRNSQASHETKIASVVDEDCIDCALRLIQHRLCAHPVVHILADDYFPGGSVGLGSGAQEESIFRRTNICRTLTQNLYPLLDGEVVYSPNVSVLKASESDGWTPLPHPLPLLGFIAGPGVRTPSLLDDGKLSSADERRLSIKLHAVLQAALDNGHDGIVLGAMGTGAWNNPPSHVAQVFSSVLPMYSHLFKTIHIAIKRHCHHGYIVRREPQQQDDTFTIFNNFFL